MKKQRKVKLNSPVDLPRAYVQTVKMVRVVVIEEHGTFVSRAEPLHSFYGMHLLPDPLPLSRAPTASASICDVASSSSLRCPTLQDREYSQFTPPEMFSRDLRWCWWYADARIEHNANGIKLLLASTPYYSDQPPVNYRTAAVEPSGGLLISQCLGLFAIRARCTFAIMCSSISFHLLYDCPRVFTSQGESGELMFDMNAGGVDEELTAREINDLRVVFSNIAKYVLRDCISSVHRLRRTICNRH